MEKQIETEPLPPVVGRDERWEYRVSARYPDGTDVTVGRYTLRVQAENRLRQLQRDYQGIDSGVTYRVERRIVSAWAEVES